MFGILFSACCCLFLPLFFFLSYFLFMKLIVYLTLFCLVLPLGFFYAYGFIFLPDLSHL